jgi:hypothetical protein
LRPRYLIGVGVLPVGLTMASFAPTYYLVEAAARVIGVPANAPSPDPVKSVAFLAVCLGGFATILAAGYLLGFALDALVLRFVCRWPPDRLRDLFLRSVPPPHWVMTKAEAGRFPRRVARCNCYVNAALAWSLVVGMIVVNRREVTSWPWGGGLIVIMAMTGMTAVFGGQQWREGRRLRARPPGRCPACGYDLTGNASGVCPECGATATPNTP